MANGVDEQIEADDADHFQGWLIEIKDETFGDMIIAFITEVEARTAFVALSGGFVLGTGGKLTMQNRDENGNWLTIETAELK